MVIVMWSRIAKWRPHQMFSACGILSYLFKLALHKRRQKRLFKSFGYISSLQINLQIKLRPSLSKYVPDFLIYSNNIRMTCLRSWVCHSEGISCVKDIAAWVLTCKKMLVWGIVSEANFFCFCFFFIPYACLHVFSSVWMLIRVQSVYISLERLHCAAGGTPLDVEEMSSEGNHQKTGEKNVWSSPCTDQIE